MGDPELPCKKVLYLMSVCAVCYVKTDSSFSGRKGQGSQLSKMTPRVRTPEQVVEKGKANRGPEWTEAGYVAQKMLGMRVILSLAGAVCKRNVTKQGRRGEAGAGS